MPSARDYFIKDDPERYERELWYRSDAQLEFARVALWTSDVIDATERRMRHIFGRYEWVQMDTARPEELDLDYPSTQACYDHIKSETVRFPRLYLFATGLLRAIGLRR